MKTAEIIIIGCEHDGSFIPVDEVLILIKQAQEDAIIEAVNECSSQAKLYYNYSELTNSIKSVAEKLIKEL